MGIRLVEVFADEGISGGTMERPGLQDALRVLGRGRANTLVVVKLDRLTRSVKDLCTLVDDYFAKDRYDLISLCGMVNTHTAAGRLMMLNLANYAQYEAWHAATVADLLMNGAVGDSVSAGERARELRQQGRSLRHIAAQLMQEGRLPLRGGRWHPASVANLLSRTVGLH